MNKKIIIFLGILCCIAVLCAGCVSDAENTDDISEELAYFYEICKLPHPSGNTAAMQNYLISFAEQHNLPYEKDEAGNILIQHPGTSEKTIILQGHQDMVPAVEDGYVFDFNKDSVEPYIKDGWIHAAHTSLGADDGSGEAIMLAALSSPDLKDCTFSCIFTVDEETTMLGASSINPAWLNADALVNIDGEAAQTATISSAGATTFSAVFTPEEKTVPENRKWYRLTVSGLLSGHSGDDIDKGRLNAIMLAADYLSGLEDVQISAITGGTAKNAIPAGCDVVFTTTSDTAAGIEDWLAAHRAETDPGLTLTIEEAKSPEKTYTAEFTKTFLNAVLAAPNGLLEKDEYGPAVSSNLGVLTNENGVIEITCLIRAAVAEKGKETTEKIADVYRRAGADTTYEVLGPSWKEKGDTKLMQVTDNAYLKITGEHVRFVSIHAGLECGHFAEKNPDLMIVSIGPTTENNHTINERMNLENFAEVKAVTFEIVKDFCNGA